jgi:hypothetical protein
LSTTTTSNNNSSSNNYSFDTTNSATPISTATQAAASAAKKTWAKQAQPQQKKTAIDETVDGPAPSNATLGPSARSSFLKALGRFKSKHLQQKR